MDTFFGDRRVPIVFSKYALHSFQGILTALRHVIQRNFLFASIKLLSVLILTKPPYNFFHCDWSLLSSVDPLLAAVKRR
jgi:hypothetical protein